MDVFKTKVNVFCSVTGYLHDKEQYKPRSATTEGIGAKSLCLPMYSEFTGGGHKFPIFRFRQIYEGSP